MITQVGPVANRRPCPRCGHGLEIPKPEQVAEIAAGIPVAPDLKADDPVIASRLACCAACDALREDVLCAYCGCFVLFRARPKESCCPHPESDKWLLQNPNRHAEGPEALLPPVFRRKEVEPCTQYGQIPITTKELL